MFNKFDIEIASIPTQEDLVAEIFYNDVQWVQIYKKNNELLVKFYSPSTGEYWEFLLDNAIDALIAAKSKLLKIG